MKYEKGKRKYFYLDASTSKLMSGVLFDPHLKEQERAELRYKIIERQKQAALLGGVLNSKNRRKGSHIVPGLKGTIEKR